MRYRKTAVFGALLALTVLRAEAQEQFPVLPVEMFGCTYQDGQTLADLDPANDAFNQWADDAGITQLTSLMLQ